MKTVEIIDPFIPEREGMIQVFQRNAAVGFKIPEGMVEVKKEVPVFHPAKYEAAGNGKNGVLRSEISLYEDRDHRCHQGIRESHCGRICKARVMNCCYAAGTGKTWNK